MKQGFVKTKPYCNIFLTNKGNNFAEGLSERHKTIKNFLMKFFNYDDIKAYNEAHNLEHSFSDESIDMLKAFLGDKRIGNAPCYVG